MKPLQYVQNYQKKTHVHENGHDEKYKCGETQCQNIYKMQGTITKEDTWRGTKIQFMIIIWTQKGKTETQKYVKNDNQETVGIGNQMGNDEQE